MLLSDFATLLDMSTADAIAFARSMVLDELPDSYTYRVFPNQSCDKHLEPDEVAYPGDSLDGLHDYIEMGRDDCIRFLYRGGRVPEWISGKHDTVALRVSAHPLVRNLCLAYGGPLVSTSANPQWWIIQAGMPVLLQCGIQ